MEFEEFKEDFIIEITEELDKLEEILLNIENESDSKENLSEIYRIFHTIKGSAGFLELDNISNCAHKGETLLDFIIRNNIKVDSSLVDIFFKFQDFFKHIIVLLQKNEDVSKVVCDDLINEVDKKLKELGLGEKNSTNHINKNEEKENEREEVPGSICVKCEISSDFKMKGMKAYLIYNKLAKKFNILKAVPPVEEYDNDDFEGNFSFYIEGKESDIPEIKKIIESVSLVNLKEIKVLEEKGSNKKSGHKETSNKEEINKQEEDSKKITSKKNNLNREDEKLLDLQFIKIPINRLDTLLNLVGELVIVNAGFFTLSDKIRDKYKLKELYMEVRDRIQQLSRISHTLQENIMKIRMLPLRNIFVRYKRFIRDYAKETNKKINLIIKGEDTELDKKVMDIISEPLTHLIRNAIDHGIETVEERRKKGKPEEGTIEIDAYQESNYIIISISDDGAGIDIEKIKEKALEKKIVSEDKVNKMSREQLLNLIFEPGFSTAEKVSKISGRGIGMDIVKKTLVDIQGILDIKTEKDKGTTFQIKIPITLAIITAILVQVADDIFAIPMSSVVETIKIEEEEIITIDWQEAVKLRNSILPLLRLDSVLKPEEDNSNNVIKEKLPVIIVSYMNKNVGLVVDKLIGKQEIVIKSLSSHYRNIKGIAGASIMGDGSVILIIDIKDIIDIARERLQSLPPEKRIKLPESSELQSMKSRKNLNIDDLIDKIQSLRKNSTLLEIDNILSALPTIKLEEEDYKRLYNVINQGNRGAVNVFQSMVDKDIKVSSPDLKIVNVNVFKRLLQNISSNFIFLSTDIEGSGKGKIIFSLPVSNAIKLSRMMIGDDTSFNVLTDEDKSALIEITNILSSSYTNVLTTYTKYKMSPTVPKYYKNNLEDIIADIDKILSSESEVVVVKTNFLWKDNSVIGYLFLLLKEDIISYILNN